MTDQELRVGDRVEVFDDYRQLLNGKQGMVFAVVGSRIHVEFDDVPSRWRRAIVPRQNLKKVEKT
jgi:hypothetical protein